ncbi:hypothetical protein [Zavarzinella formosa]|uniref:hypothetical protein n=1 Tax=Zavarzinella formosa TaxID=360055 RepID=UPI0002E72FBD|nr:hypothetical protein [Zavarzinella formosa]
MAKIHHLLNKLALAEDRFRSGEFLAPSLGGGGVTVRVEGVVTRYELPGRFVGWGVFRADGSRAVFDRRATLAEQRAYRQLFPVRPVFLIAQAEDGWLAWPAHDGDARFGETSLLTVQFAEDVQPFDRVETRFDGSQAWFDHLNDRRDVSAARHLREALRDRLSPDSLAFPGLTPEHRQAYRLAWRLLTGHAEAPASDRRRAWEVTGLNLGRG